MDTELEKTIFQDTNEEEIDEKAKEYIKGWMFFKKILTENEENIELLEIGKKYLISYPKLFFMNINLLLKDDFEIVLEAVKHKGKLLYYASNRLKNNKDIVLEAIKNDSSSIIYATKKLQKELK
jgi:hypothetical protein